MNIGQLFGPSDNSHGKILKQAVGDDAVSTGPLDKVDWGEVGETTAIATGVGAGVGAIGGYIDARMEINKVPIQTTTQTWQEPTTKDVSLGNIPHDQYFPASHLFGFGSGGFMNNELNRPSVHPDLRPTDPVVRSMPQLDAGGNPIFHDVTKTFADHGRPIVETHSHTVTLPSLTGFQEHQSDDTHWTTHYYTDSDGKSQSEIRTVLDGVQVRFEPQVKQDPVQSPHATYETKSVHFDSGVNVGALVLRGALMGAGLGAIAGLVGDLAKQTLLDRNH